MKGVKVSAPIVFIVLVLAGGLYWAKQSKPSSRANAYDTRFAPLHI